MQYVVVQTNSFFFHHNFSKEKMEQY